MDHSMGSCRGAYSSSPPRDSQLLKHEIHSRIHVSTLSYQDPTCCTVGHYILLCLSEVYGPINRFLCHLFLKDVGVPFPSGGQLPQSLALP